MKIKKLVRDESYVSITYVTDGKLAAEEHQVKYHEAPTPEFDELLQELGPVVANILEVGKEYADTIKVRSLTISRTKHGTKSVEIGFVKALDAVDGLHRMATPMFQIDDAADAEQGHRQCSAKQAKLIYEMIEHAEKYVAGERQQLILPLVEKAEGEEDDDSEALPFPTAAGQ